MVNCFLSAEVRDVRDAACWALLKAIWLASLRRHTRARTMFIGEADPLVIPNLLFQDVLSTSSCWACLKPLEASFGLLHFAAFRFICFFGLGSRASTRRTSDEAKHTVRRLSYSNYCPER